MHFAVAPRRRFPTPGARDCKGARCVAPASASDHGRDGAGHARNGVAAWKVLRQRAGPVAADASELRFVERAPRPGTGDRANPSRYEEGRSRQSGKCTYASVQDGANAGPHASAQADATRTIRQEARVTPPPNRSPPMRSAAELGKNSKKRIRWLVQRFLRWRAKKRDPNR